MSTPENAWQILMSEAKTDVSSYYVTLPADISYLTHHPEHVPVYDLEVRKLDICRMETK